MYMSYLPFSNTSTNRIASQSGGLRDTRRTKKYVPIRYLPKNLSAMDKRRQINMLAKSRKLYQQHKYYTRKPLPSYRNKTSRHITNARKIYNIDKITPSVELSRVTGCTVPALEKIVKKGEGAYFSSGSRPNQTAQSWGLARLASSITSGKSAAVDYAILESGCNHKKKAFILAEQARKKYGHGRRKTQKIAIIAK